MESWCKWRFVLVSFLMVMTATHASVCESDTGGHGTKPGGASTEAPPSDLSDMLQHYNCPSIGTLRVDGAYIYLNGAATHDGMKVRFGDTLTTGPGSSARLEFSSGGYLQLDENTDPLFTWIEQAKCILIRLIHGQAYLDKGKVCVEGPNLNLVLNSEANIRLKADTSELTLLRGSANVSRPRRLTVEKSQQLKVRGQNVIGVRTLSEDELSAVTAWRGRFFFKLQMPDER